MYKVFFFILAGVLFLALPVRAYDTYMAHPGISGLTVDVYNEISTENILTNEEKEWLKQGSTQEDVPTRWVNHFFDPGTGWGLKAMALPTPVWSDDSMSQANFSLGDKSWQRAIDDFNKGNKELAFKELGHVLHLIADVSVPAHTRDDIHVFPGDGYENYVKNKWSSIKSLIENDLDYIQADDLESSFSDMATFTNTRFFSDDTIINSKYGYPFIPEDENGYIIYKNQDGEEHKLIYKKYDSYDESGDVRYYLNETVFLDYAQTLIPKAIGHGAGLIDLFFAEAERLKQEELELSKTRITLAGYLNRVLGYFIQSAEQVIAYLKENQQPVLMTARATHDIRLIAAAQIYEEAKDVEPQQIVDDLEESMEDILPPLEAPKPVTPEPAPVPLPIPEKIIPVVVLPPDTILVDELLVDDEIATSTLSPRNDSEMPEPIVFVQTPTSQTPTVETVPETPEISTTTPTSTPDILPPDIPTITITDQSDFSSAGLQIVLNSADAESAVVFYDLEYAIVSATATPPSPLGTAPSWKEGDESIASSTTSTAFDFAGERGQTYIFRARAQDDVGNYSDWKISDEHRLDWNKMVVVNEIAWAGTSAGGVNDEWLELYNNTNEPINFASSTWQILIYNGSSTTTINLNKNIPAQGFYLLERTDDTSVNNIPADQIYTGAIKNEGARVVLQNNGEIIDEIDCSTGWFAGANTTDFNYYPSMERKNSLEPGSLAGNWQNSAGMRAYNNNLIYVYGSPKQNNFTPIYLSGTQFENVRTLTPEYNPYFLSEYTIPAGKKLVIQPGVILKAGFISSKLDVYGELEINGTAENQVFFTSGRDNTFIEDKWNIIYGTWTNTTTPLAKDWAGFRLYALSSTTINYGEIKYAGNVTCLPPFCSAKVSRALWSEDANLEINNTKLISNGDMAIYLKNTTSTIKNSSFTNGDQALVAESSQINLADSGFENFWNSNGPLQFRYDWPDLSNLTFSSTTFSGAYLLSATLKKDKTISKDIDYLLSEPTINIDTSLNVSAGTKIYLPAYGSFTVYGTLNTNGTAEEPIFFEPYASGTSWGNLLFSNSTSTLNHTILKHGGTLTTIPVDKKGNVIVNNSDLTINNCRVENARIPGSGILSANSILKINNSFVGNDDKSTKETFGISLGGGELSADNITMQNLTYGFYIGGSPTPPYTIINTPSENYVNVDVPVWP